MGRHIIKRLTLKEFAFLVGEKPGNIYKECRDILKKNDLRYRILDKKESEKLMLQILNKIENKVLPKSGKERKSQWEDGWQENLDNFIKSDYNVNMLVPGYIRPNQPARLFGEYIMPLDNKFELYWYTAFRLWLFKKYLGNLKNVYEFGCGSAYNLVILSKLFPEKKLIGLDWADSSVKIVNLLKSKLKINAQGEHFDVFSRDNKVKIEKDSALLTMGCLEQTGDNFKIFLEYMLAQKPSVCVHMEPLIELYDEDSMFDYVAIKYHKSRNYLGDFIAKLRELETENKIKIIKIQKVSIGNMYHQGYNYIVWKSVK